MPFNLSGVGSFLANLFRGGGGGFQKAGGGYNVGTGKGFGSFGTGGNSWVGTPKQSFSDYAGPLALMFGSQAIPNPGVPRLPQQSFGQYKQQALAGGPPISQTGAGAVSGILNTPFQQVSGDEESAALHGLNLQKQEELRGLTGMYKSLRPGTDPLTDTIYQRDLGLMNDRYARAQAETLAQLHRQAYNDYSQRQLYGGQVAGSLGQEQMNNMNNLIQTEYYPKLQAYQASLDKRAGFRNSLQQLAQLPFYLQLFRKFNVR